MPLYSILAKSTKSQKNVAQYEKKEHGAQSAGKYSEQALFLTCRCFTATPTPPGFPPARE